MNVKVRCLCVSTNFRAKQAKQDHQKGFMSLQCRKNKDEYFYEMFNFVKIICHFFLHVFFYVGPAQQNSTKQMTMLGLFYFFAWFL